MKAFCEAAAAVPGSKGYMEQCPTGPVLENGPRFAESLAPLIAWLRKSWQDPAKRRAVGSVRGRAAVDLHDAENQCAAALRPLLRLAEAYEWHQLAARRQHAAAVGYQRRLSVGEVFLQADWKQNVTLPLAHSEVGDDWFAPSRKEISVFGAALRRCGPSALPRGGSHADAGSAVGAAVAPAVFTRSA